MASGANTKHLVGPRTNKDTPATQFYRYFAKSNSMAEKFTSKESEALTGHRFGNDEAVVGIAVDGDVPMEYTKETLARLMAIIGTDETITGTGPYIHTFKIGQTVSKWVDVVKVMAGLGMGSEFHFERFNNCKVNTFSIDLVEQTYITGSVGFMGVDMESGNTDFKTDTPTGVTVTDITDPKLLSFDTSVKFGGDIDAIINSLKINLNNNLKDRYGLPNKTRKKIEAQKGELTLDLECDFDTAKYTDLKTKIKGNTYITDCEISIGDGIKIKFPRLKLTDVGSPINGSDEITVPIKAKALWDDTAGTVMIVEITDSHSETY